MMASNHAFSPRLSSAEPPPIEDCRDYLRTGRCKYGASCKFNHPPNVQSGGGMKTPMDPSEPMFPVRPTEPICQYYMKHGTCKFGQACKFHHPPQTGVKTTTFLAGGNTVVLNGDAASVPQHILLNPVDSSSSTMMLQFLPQRPDEPDCIYFLRNGRCKYGATCRYHHPVGYHQGRQTKTVETVRMAPVQIQLPAQVTSDGTVLASQLVDSGSIGSKVQYVATQPSCTTVTYATSQSQTRLVSKSNGGRVLVSESPARRSSNNSQYIHLSHQEVGMEYQAPVGEPLGGPMGLSQEHGSSSSSIASSYETAVSSFEGNGRSSQVENTSAAGHWTRSMRSSSSNNLHSYTNTGVRNSQVRISGSESNLAARNMRHRAASFGSVGDFSETSSQVYHDAATSLERSNSLGWSGGAPQSLPTHLEKGGFMERLSSDAPPGMDLQHRSRSSYRSESSSFGSGYDDGSSTHQDYVPHGVPPRKVTIASRNAARQGGGGVDQGLSMMTSALLTMLDTPEEAPMKINPASRETSSSTLHPSPPVTPRSANTLPTNDPVSLDEQLMPPSTGYSRDHRAGYVYAAPSHQDDLYATSRPPGIGQQQRYASQLSTSAPSYQQHSSSRVATFSGVSPARDDVVDSRWSPTWHQQQQHQASHQHQENLSVGLQQTKRSHGSIGSHPEPSDVGLYLP